MKITDFVYGDFEINEPVLIELINSKPIQRLKNISQYGVPAEYCPLRGFSRYDHSVGVMLLLRKLKAPIKEQIAGLLHDVSHTAFSHVVDWVFNHKNEENFHDTIYEKMIEQSDIPIILNKYAFNANDVINLEKYLLLEREIPYLCADRVDYSLKEIYLCSSITDAKFCLSNLTAYNNKIAFTSKNAAYIFGKEFIKCQMTHWGGAEHSLRFYLLAKILKIGLSNNIINMNDLYQDDVYVMNKLKLANNDEINSILNLLSGDLKFITDETNPEIDIKKKFRYVDPEYLDNGKLYKLSETDENYRILIGENRKINEKGIKIRLVN